MKKKHVLAFLLVCSASLLFSTTASAEQIGITTSKETLSKSYGGKVYSPYAQRSFPTFPLWGETHLHTGYSMDAGLFGNHPA